MLKFNSNAHDYVILKTVKKGPIRCKKGHTKGSKGSMLQLKDRTKKDRKMAIKKDD